jgi:hypothetical protein
MEKKQEVPAQFTPPIIVQNDSVTPEKMRAIVNLSQAILEMAKALNDVNSSVTISNCTINSRGGTAIEVKG